MTQKRKSAGAAKKPKAAKPPKPIAAYIVVRELPSETPTFTEPDRVFANKGDALKYARERNRELRSLTCPFDGNHNDPDRTMKGGEKALVSLVKKLKLPVPKKGNGKYSFGIDWEAWWDGLYFDMTDAQRETIWDAQDQFDWYKVKSTTVEG